jgi:hypothetical protein
MHLGMKQDRLPVALLKKYLAEKLSIKINGKASQMNFLVKNWRGCSCLLFKHKRVSKINSLETYNAILVDLI